MPHHKASTWNNAGGQLINGDCCKVMARLPSESVDLVVTDPPYLVNYRATDGRTVPNDDTTGTWLVPAFQQMYRLLKQDSFCGSFYGWNSVEVFMRAWKQAGFKPVGHLTWIKTYSSNRRARKHYLRYQHENAYLLVKGTPAPPRTPLADVLTWRYTGNTHHPTEKPVSGLAPLIATFSKRGDVVLDPFAGAGSTAVAAAQFERRYLAIELDERYYRTARKRLASLTRRTTRDRDRC